MKKFIILSTLGLLCAFSAQASSRCETSLNVTIFKTDGSIFSDRKISGETKTIRTKTWEDCYNYAIERSKEYRETVFLELSGRRISGGTAEALGYLFIEWTFDDGFFVDTDGKVTKYTDDFELSPLDSDLRYFYDGTLFR